MANEIGNRDNNLLLAVFDSSFFKCNKIKKQTSDGLLFESEKMSIETEKKKSVDSSGQNEFEVRKKKNGSLILASYVYHVSFERSWKPDKCILIKVFQLWSFRLRLLW